MRNPKIKIAKKRKKKNNLFLFKHFKKYKKNTFINI